MVKARWEVQGFRNAKRLNKSHELKFSASIWPKTGKFVLLADIASVYFSSFQGFGTCRQSGG